MPRSFFTLLQLGFLVLGAWWLCGWVASWHTLLLLASVIIAGGNTAACLVVTQWPSGEAFLNRFSSSHIYLRWIRSHIGLPRQASSRGSRSVATPRLRTAAQFAAASEQAKAVVRGHDEALDQIFETLKESATLTKPHDEILARRPHASFLLCGPPGIGKRHTARVVSKLYFGSGGVIAFDCARATTDQLVGYGGEPGELLQAVHDSPCGVLLFEQIEKASPGVADLLTKVLSGTPTEPSRELGAVSFDRAIVFLTTIKGATDHRLSGEALRRDLVDREIAPGLVDRVDQVLPLTGLNDRSRAEVAAILLANEAKARGVSLSYVAPEVLMSLLLKQGDDPGVASLPGHVSRLLRKPLVASAEGGYTSLALRVRPRANQLAGVTA